MDRTRYGLIVIVGLFCILGVVYSVVVPLFEAPDEIWHFSFVRVLATQRTLPIQPTEGKNVWLREAGQPPLYYLVAAPFVAPMDTSDFPDFVRFNAAHPAVTPGIQSDATNVFIHTPHEKFPYQGAVLAVHVVRLLSVLWGAGTVVGAYLVAREIVPDRPALALAAATITAFNPHFIFISSVVNNDVSAACVCTFALWLVLRLKRETRVLGKQRRFSFAQSGKTLVSLGIVLGLALLTKMSALALLPLVALALGLMWWRDRDVRALFVRGTVILSLAGLVGFWWYARNWALYGDPLAWGVWMMDLPVKSIGLIELVRQFGHVATSYWSPYNGLFPVLVFWVLGLLVTLAVGGWVRMIIRRDVRAKTEGVLLAGTWFLLLFASLVKYMVTTPSDEGRLLFPGIAAFSLLVALGLEAITPQRWTSTTLCVVGTGLLILSVASPFWAIAPRYALPLVNSIDDISPNVSLGDAVFDNVRLLGMDVAPDVVQLDETVNLTLYWEALSTPPVNLRAVVQLWTVGGRLVGQLDKTPAGAIYPPDLWRAGDIVRDTYRMHTNEQKPAMCRVIVRVMAGDAVLGEASSPALLRMTGAPVLVEKIAHPLAYTLNERIELIGYGVSPDEPLSITLYWRAQAEIDETFMVFVHLVDESGTLRAQGDGPPLDNDYPTKFWSPGEVLADTHVVPLPNDLPANVHLLVGLYRLADGARLPVYTAQGERVLNDAIRLDVYD
ncbi:MAG: hypothetical protein GY832_16100 [Chloroflexi bacterium]|nr:hypothetical protein [Chloroflexota bacterium]